MKDDTIKDFLSQLEKFMVAARCLTLSTILSQEEVEYIIDVSSTRCSHCKHLALFHDTTSRECFLLDCHCHAPQLNN